MSIVVSVRTTKFAARNNGIGGSTGTSVNASPEALANNDFKKHPCIKTVESA